MFLVLCVVVGVFIVWVLLVASAWLSLRWTKTMPARRPVKRLMMAVVPVVLGWFLFRFHIQFQMNDVKMRLSWLFIVPIVVGTAAVLSWLLTSWRRRNAG